MGILPALTLKQYNSGSPYKPLVPLESLSLLEPKVSACKREFVHWPFKKMPEFPAAFCLTRTDEIPLIFTTSCYGAPLPGTGVPGWGARLGAGPLASKGTTAAEIPLQILNRHTWV